MKKLILVLIVLLVLPNMTSVNYNSPLTTIKIPG